MFCHKCGIQIAEVADFCHKCGTKVVCADTAQQTPDVVTPPTAETAQEFERDTSNKKTNPIKSGGCSWIFLAPLASVLLVAGVLNGGSLGTKMIIGAITISLLRFGFDIAAKIEDPKKTKRFLIIAGMAAVAVIAIALAVSNGNNSKGHFPDTPGQNKTDTMFAWVKEPVLQKQDGSRVVVGSIKNISKTNFSYVAVNFKTYDSLGNYVGNAMDNMLYFGPGTTWDFHAYIWDERVVSFEFDSVTYDIYTD